MSNETQIGPLTELVSEIGRPVSADDVNDVHRASVGPFQLLLRRDCHGVLRKLEISFPPGLRDQVSRRIGEGWRSVSPGELDLLDITGVGKLYLLSNRLEIVFRMSVSREAVAELVLRCVDRSGP